LPDDPSAATHRRVRRDADRLRIDRSQCDTCPASSPKDASKIAEALTQAPRKEIVYMESAAIQGQPCEAQVAAQLLGYRAGDS
jgi:hypothetical protein